MGKAFSLFKLSFVTYSKRLYEFSGLLYMDIWIIYLQQMLKVKNKNELEEE